MMVEPPLGDQQSSKPTPLDPFGTTEDWKSRNGDRSKEPRFRVQFPNAGGISFDVPSVWGLEIVVRTGIEQVRIYDDHEKSTDDRDYTFESKNATLHQRTNRVGDWECNPPLLNTNDGTSKRPKAVNWRRMLQDCAYLGRPDAESTEDEKKLAEDFFENLK